MRQTQSNQPHLWLPAETVRELTLCWLHSLDQTRVCESFVIAGGLLRPVRVVYQSDSYDLRSTRYPGAKVKVMAHKIIIKDIPHHHDLTAIKGRVAHNQPQLLSVQTQAGERKLNFSQIGPGGTGYIITLSPAPNR